MRIAMLALAGLSIGLGLLPGWMGSLLPPLAGMRVLTAGHIAAQLGLFAGAGICYILLLALLRPAAGITLDLDRLWRDLPARLGPSIRRGIRLTPDLARRQSLDALLEKGGIPRLSAGRLLRAAHWRTGDVALAATAILGAALLIAAL
jgi:multicomponent Na+:H+ antiporter subunit D